MVLGKPLATLIKEEAVGGDEDLRTFLATEQEADFYLVLLACSFEPVPSMHFKDAKLTVVLNRQNVDLSAPVAWSLKPTAPSDPVEVSETLKLGMSLKLAEASIERGERRQRAERGLIAYGELTSTPAWRLQQRRYYSLNGSKRFAIVVRATKGSEPWLLARLDARTVRWPYRLRRPADALPLEFGTYLAQPEQRNGPWLRERGSLPPPPRMGVPIVSLRPDPESGELRLTQNQSLERNS